MRIVLDNEARYAYDKYKRARRNFFAQDRLVARGLKQPDPKYMNELYQKMRDCLSEVLKHKEARRMYIQYLPSIMADSMKLNLDRMEENYKKRNYDVPYNDVAKMQVLRRAIAEHRQDQRVDDRLIKDLGIEALIEEHKKLYARDRLEELAKAKGKNAYRAKRIAWYNSHR